MRTEWAVQPTGAKEVGCERLACSTHTHVQVSQHRCSLPSRPDAWSELYLVKKHLFLHTWALVSPPRFFFPQCWRLRSRFSPLRLKNIQVEPCLEVGSSWSSLVGCPLVAPLFRLAAAARTCRSALSVNRMLLVYSDCAIPFPQLTGSRSAQFTRLVMKRSTITKFASSTC